MSVTEQLRPATRFPFLDSRAVYEPRPWRELQFPLTDEQLAHYREHGWVVLRGLFGGDEMRRIAELADELLATRRDLLHPENLRFEWYQEDGAHKVWKIDPFVDLHVEFAALMRDRRLCDALASIYDGYEPRLFKDKFILKPAGSHGNPVHQDYNWWQGFPKSLLTATIAVDSADRSNGCTEIYPWQERFLHEPGSLKGHPPEGAVNRDEAFYLETEPGDVAIFHCLTPHAAAPNTSDRTRRQLFVSYNDSRDGEYYLAHRDHFLAYRAGRLDEETRRRHYFI